MTRHASPTMSDEQPVVAWQSASLLLGYPDDELLADLPTVVAASSLLPRALADDVRTLAGHLGSTPLEDLQADYVETFDHQRRSSLFLTYFAHGDTRKRGVALLRFKQTYLRAGFVLDDTELPDHLCVVLEFAATVDHGAGWRLLNDHRAGLEVLRLSLEDRGSPWAPAVRVVTGTLPRLRGDEREAVARLAAEGPPAEEVGLDGYGGPPVVPPDARPGPSGPQPMPDPVLLRTSR